MQNAVDIERPRVGGTVHSLTKHLQGFDCIRGKCTAEIDFLSQAKK
ncbi:hypothetical protein LAX5112_00973 [Roseibium alexandrii]|uniref:Uncharacterized protein n=2 Tax=Roseibium alexandrii TaxID=388408 RepID=A0A0M6ZW63_9HYPH|nr:hypothetical protein SADFL11_00042270 [Roseibium alexandrii DFL-11]CTQ66452.1 hypothetical protein LAX5112_00973 [Roseibium alexandrii]